MNVSKDQWGISAPLCILGLVWVRVPTLFGSDLPGSYLSYSEGFMKFG